MFELDLEKVEEAEIKLPTSVGSKRKQENSRKHLRLLHWLFQSLWLCGSQQTVENSSRDGNTKLPYLPSENFYMQVKKQQLEPLMEQRTSSKLGKEYVKAIYYHPAYLTYIQSAPCKMPGWMNHKQESRLLGEILTTAYMHMIPLSWEKVKRT